ncbi:hypothetical protein GCM10007897_14840 [Sphingobium jiangsuense]|uniref:Uncharacterized protein n=1 Tax=Sphingobium jiangsuense TaxID=870476 RepID=A0A7W6BK62_9SPHN|nr:hypothetical protein [Sphingobium jiangsuense]MBB3925072.1 hypothetical protein [Sphingobium jiangsuense]GLT00100.1 hypothetical protein GCM10007897_14840 [Sphingobium jiangsuense]
MSRAVIRNGTAYPYAVCRAGARMPRFRHQTEDEARAAAMQESIKRPGTAFYVFEEIARITVPHPDRQAPGDQQSRAATLSPSRPAQRGGARDDD